MTAIEVRGISLYLNTRFIVPLSTMGLQCFILAEITSVLHLFKCIDQSLGTSLEASLPILYPYFLECGNER